MTDQFIFPEVHFFDEYCGFQKGKKYYIPILKGDKLIIDKFEITDISSRDEEFEIRFKIQFLPFSPLSWFGRFDTFPLYNYKREVNHSHLQNQFSLISHSKKECIENLKMAVYSNENDFLKTMSKNIKLKDIPFHLIKKTIPFYLCFDKNGKLR